MDIIFLRENDDLFQVLSNIGIDTRKIAKQLNIINLKYQNNLIGYFQFKVDNEYIKISILPKIIDGKKNVNIVQNNFKKYLIKCIEIMYEYNKQNQLLKNINKNYLDIINKYKNGEIDNLESILEFKYIYALENILIYLKKLNKCKYESEYFSNNTISDILDIKRNISELNKSKIHQIRKKKVSYDEIANICYSIVQYFMKSKLNLINKNLELKKYCTKIKKYIKCNFKIKEYKFNYKNILSYKVKKKFTNRKLEIILANLLVLLDFEGYFNNYDSFQMYLKCENIISIAFDPSLVYEYFVYSNELSNNNQVEFSRINNKKDNCIKKDPEYYAFIDNTRNTKLDINKSANPDFIIDSEIVKDCKWKVINSLSDIKEDDVEKLKRDCVKRNINKGVLVYPLINCEYEKIEWGCNTYNAVDDIFIWRIEEQRIL